MISPLPILTSAFAIAFALSLGTATALSSTDKRVSGDLSGCDTQGNLQACHLPDIDWSGLGLRGSVPRPLSALSAVDLWFASEDAAEEAPAEETIADSADWHGSEVDTGESGGPPAPHAERLPTVADDPSMVFDPAAVILLGAGLLGLCAVRRRKSMIAARAVAHRR